MRWIPFAMVRIATVFIAGILLCIYFPEFLTTQNARRLFLSLGVSYILVWFFLQRSKALRLSTGIPGLSAIFLAGYLNVMLKDESRQEDNLLHVADKISAYQVKLLSSVEEKEKSWKRTGLVQAIRVSDRWQEASGKVNLYWPKSEKVSHFDYGDILLVKGAPNELEPAYNPHEFDFKEYLGFKNIYHQHFLQPDSWSLLTPSHDRGFLFYANHARKWSVASVKQFIRSPREQAIVIALVLGVTDGLDNDLRNAYAASGAMHVLAVSGLHVSIIYGILLFFFKPLTGSVGGRWVVGMLSLVLLWGYAFLTGLSPSVLRAVVMFSFMIVAKLIGRNPNIYNTLAASAFCLLIYDPFLIMSVGFQLSYLAVLGIVYIQRPLYNLWETKSSFADWAWQLSCVSIAAQSATFAWGLLYFHQFPVYFLVANLFIIPGSFVVLVAGILLVLVSPFDFIATWLGISLEWFVKILNEGIFLVERFPYSLISNVSISVFQCLLLVVSVLAGLWLLRTRTFQPLLLITLCIILFSSASWKQYHNDVKKSSLIVYRIKNQSAIEWLGEGHSFFLADSSLLTDRGKIGFHIQPNRVIRGVKTVHTISAADLHATSGLQFYTWKGKTFLRIHLKEFRLPEALKIDYLIVSHNAVGLLRPVIEHMDFKYLIFDSSNSYRYCEEMEKEARQLQKPSYSVLKEGAFTLNL